MSMMNDILRTAVQNKASDVHINVGAPPLFRIHTVVTPSDFPIVTPEGSTRLLKEILPEKRWPAFEELRDADFPAHISGERLRMLFQDLFAKEGSNAIPRSAAVRRRLRRPQVQTAEPFVRNPVFRPAEGPDQCAGCRGRRRARADNAMRRQRRIPHVLAALAERDGHGAANASSASEIGD